MPARAPSPALSENALDISGGLLGEDSDADSVQDRTSKSPLSPVNLRRGKQEIQDVSDSDDEFFIASALAGANRKASNLKGRSVKKGGGFQAMGLNANLLKAITRKGFSVPTPIQRKTIPLVTSGQDVVGMARTGSGKTAAFVIPMVEKLKVHSAKVGARALIMSPSRELALQTLKVVKELGRGTDLRCTLLVGGDSLEEQFKDMASNPDIIIATPGRFLHLKVEMSLDLSSIQYVVFDEADRLFEMGFAAQLHEILHSLPLSRQTLLFSATMPSSMIEFTKAGLNEPKLVRLDAEQKISPDLQSAFFSVKSADKEGALLHILHDIIKVPIGPTENARRIKADQAVNKKKRKRGHAEGVNYNQSPTEHSTIIFTATKHHVEYIGALLREAGFATSYVYGSLDQTARKMHIQDFRSGMTHVMVVTDVAARGIDIPILANVINYDFPPQPKIFIHRVGRTARAGQRGWSYNLVLESDVPYLLDLQLFLGKRLLLGREGAAAVTYGEDVTLGNLPRDRVSSNAEWVIKLLEENIDISALKDVSIKGEKLYKRTRNSASSQSAKRAKDITAAQSWTELHPLFNNDSSNMEAELEKMLARVSEFRPQETIFEIGRRGTQGEAGEIVKKRRETIEAKRKRQETQPDSPEDANDKFRIPGRQREDLKFSSSKIGKDNREAVFDDSYDDDGFEVTITETASSKNAKTSRDDSVYMSYTPVSINEHEDRAYGVHSGSNQPSFLTEARSAAMDLALDEGGKGFGEAGARGKRWDKRHKKYVSVANDEDGSKGQRLVRSESGAKIPASLRSGRFEAWKKSNRIDRLPRVGESESKNHSTGGPPSGKRWRHKADKAPQAPDKARDDFYKQRKKFDAAKEKRQGMFRDGGGRSELKGASEVRKERIVKAKRKEKSTRPSKKLKR